MNKESQIIQYLKTTPNAKAIDISESFDISRQMTHRYLKRMISKKTITKSGTPPQVYYNLPKVSNDKNNQQPLPTKISQLLNKEFLYIDSMGQRNEGAEGFKKWCNNRSLPIQGYANKYLKINKKYQRLKLKSGLISGLKKLKQTFKQINLDNLFYLDFYSLEIFGKTKLGQLLLYAKQSQNKKLIYEVAEYCKQPILDLIKKEKIDAIAFTPPTIKRENQFMKLLQKNLALPLPIINIKKIKQEIPIPQKTLSKLKDRIINAQTTFAIGEKRTFNHILIIDDAVGSGATLNELAGKLKAQKISPKITGLAITGSAKGFDVISEV